MVRFILFILFFYLIYFLVKYLFLKPFKDGYRQKRDHQNSRGFQNPFHKEKEGDVSITYNPDKEQRSSSEVGEYVDYEEVKE